MSSGETSGATLVDDFPEQANVLTFKFAVSLNFEPVFPEGAALGGSPSLEDVVVSTELIPEQGMDSRPLSMKSKLPISLTDVFTSEFTVSFNSEHVGAAPGGSPLPAYAISSMELIFKQEICVLTVDIHVRSLTHFRTHATGRSSTGEQKWLKVFPFSRRRHVGKTLFQAKDRFQITVRQVKIARFAGECLPSNSRSHSISNSCNRQEQHWEGLHFLCTSSRQPDSIASKR